MGDVNDRRGRKPDDREIGGKINRYINVMIAAIVTTVILPILVYAGTQDARWTAATLAACVLAAVLIGRRAGALDDTYQKMQREKLDFDGILGEFIQLDSFDPDGAFTRAELSHLCPDGGWNAASYKLRGRNRMRGSWKGCRLDSAGVDYYSESSPDRDGPQVATQLIKGQVTMLEARTGFPGKLLLIRPARGYSVTKVTQNVLLRQTGLSGMEVRDTSLAENCWQVFCASPGNAAALLRANRAFTERLNRASRLQFMLIEPDRVTFCGDYQFETVDYRLGIEATGKACRSAMRALVEEGLQTVDALREGQPA